MEGRLHAPEIFEHWARSNGFQLNFDPASQGGLVRKESMIAGYVRPPLYRASRGRELTLQDVRPVTLQDKPTEQLGFEQTDSGLEMEFFGFDPTGEFTSLMNDNDPYFLALQSYNEDTEERSNKIGFTREMSSNCVEATFDHGTNIRNRNANYLTTIQTLVAI